VKEYVRKLDKLLRLARRPSARRALLKYRVAAAVEHDPLLAQRRFALVIDVGANRGQFSLAVRHFQPEAQIVAFEPLAQAAAVYRSVFSADTRVEFHQCAIGRQRGHALMQVSRHEDSSSVLPIADLMPTLYRGTETARTETVAIASLADFVAQRSLRRPALLKIDVQGYELEVLKSAEDFLPYFDCVYVETSFVVFYEGQPLTDEVIDFLHARGFRLCGVHNLAHHPRTGTALQADFLFEKRAP
jgi:FkbM family methyltransferase